MAQAFPHRPLCKFIESGVCLQIPERGHTADIKFILPFLHSIQAKPGEVDRGGNIPVPHFQPDHPAQNAGRLLLIQFIGLCNAFYFYIIFDLQHLRYPFFPFITNIICQRRLRPETDKGCIIFKFNRYLPKNPPESKKQQPKKIRKDPLSRDPSGFYINKLSVSLSAPFRFCY